ANTRMMYPQPRPGREADPEKPDPREAACGEQIWPEAADARPPQSGSDADRSGQDERATREVHLSRLIEHREGQEPEGVGGYTEKKKERNYGMRSEDESRDEIRDGEIHRQGDRPADGQPWFVEGVDDANIHERRHGGCTDRRTHRQQGPPP